MRNNPIYKNLAALVSDYTLAQIQNVTPQQVLSAYTIAYGTQFAGVIKRLQHQWPNIQRRLIKMKKESLKDEVVESLVNIPAFKNYMDTNYPGWVSDRGVDCDKWFIRIYPDGRNEDAE